MRVLLFFIFALTASLPAGEPTPAPTWPLWDGQESVERYAQRVKLPPTQTLDLGNNVKLELVLIPAGQFIMGTPEPPPVDEDGFRKKIIVGQALLAASAGALLVMLLVVTVQAVRKKRRPQISLGLLLLVTVVAGGCVLSELHWREAERGREKARGDFIAAKARYDSADDSEKPAHSVTLTPPFYMGKFVVTQEQYARVTGQNRSYFKGRDKPVEMVSWDDAQAFCENLSEQTKQYVRLPSEAEWEYACRAGTTTKYHSGDTLADLGCVAWYSDNSNNTTHSVGQKERNAFGLYDMHGNVWQWCQDWWEDDYSKSSSENPQGPAHGAFRVLRGGSWSFVPMRCRSATRIKDSPDDRFFGLGFRVVAAPDFRVP